MLITILIKTLLALFVAIIVHKIVILVSKMSKESWKGERCRFLMLIIGHALIGGGALGVFLEIWWSGFALVFGIGLKFHFDRRLLHVDRSVLVHQARS